MKLYRVSYYVKIKRKRKKILKIKQINTNQSIKLAEGTNNGHKGWGVEPIMEGGLSRVTLQKVNEKPNFDLIFFF